MSAKGLPGVGPITFGRFAALLLPASLCITMSHAGEVAAESVIVSTNEQEISDVEVRDINRTFSIRANGAVVVREQLHISGSQKVSTDEWTRYTSYFVSSSRVESLLQRVERDVEALVEENDNAILSEYSLVIELEYQDKAKTLRTLRGTLGDVDNRVSDLYYDIVREVENFKNDARKLETKIEIIRSDGDSVTPQEFDWRIWKEDPFAYYGRRIVVRGYLINAFEEIAIFENEEAAAPYVYDKKIRIGAISSFSDIATIAESGIKGDVEIVGVLFEGVGQGILSRVTSVVPIERARGGNR